MPFLTPTLEPNPLITAPIIIGLQGGFSTVSVSGATKIGHEARFETFDGGIAFKRVIDHTFTFAVSDSQSVVDLESLESMKNSSDPVFFNINGKILRGMLKSFSLETSNQNGVAFANMTIEEETSADSCPNGYCSDFCNAFSSMVFVESISEDISVSRGENSADFSRRINIKFKSAFAQGGNAPLVRQAKRFADGVFSRNFSVVKSIFAGFNPEEDITDIFRDSFKTFHSETYDSVTNECSFEETLSAENIKGNYSHSATQSISIGTDGIVKIKENGKIIGLSESRAISAQDGYEAELANAKTRLLAVFEAYNENCQGMSDINFISTSKKIDQFKGEIEYTVEADNDERNKDLGTDDPIRFEKELSFTVENGEWTATEKGTISSLKTQSYDGGQQDNKYPRLASAYSYYRGLTKGAGLPSFVSSAGCKKDLSPEPISRNLSLRMFAGVVDYDVTYSTEKRFEDNKNVKSISANSSINYGVKSKNEFKILNEPILIQEMLGNRAGNQTVSVDILDYRKNPTSHGSTFADLLSKAESAAGGLIVSNDKNFVESASAVCTPINDVTMNYSISISREMEDST